MKIGLIRERKIPSDKRVAFSPKQIIEIQNEYPNVFDFTVESSPVRCFTDQEYEDLGIKIGSDLSDCDLLMGIKEVPVEYLIPDKTYAFFSHTIKKQAHNRRLLQAILEKNIKLVDYEVLKDEKGERTVAFGRWAGIVGAYNGLLVYGQKSGLYSLKRAFECFDRTELELELKKVQLPPIKIVVTGGGRVGKGVLEVLQAVGIKQINPHDLIHQYYEEAVFAVLSSADYNRRKTDGGYDKYEFYAEPQKYESHFLKYAEVSDILIAAAYWDSRAPKLFSLKDISAEDFNISVIADITCDIDGSVPTTLRVSTIDDPVYDVDRETFEVIPPFGKQNSISVMAIDNLPTELPRNASEEFGNQLIHHFIPELVKEESRILDKATICKEGDLTIEYMYLEDFINQTEI
ncbi:NAD(P)-dependent oxidoreductase [Shivajiella indica]|uniref:Saccharopine dehydrogenase [NAD(+), L-lysine-forming] n=1 Tax=Shivajiella indica TaxID=872115 RepID=A0ABW5BGG2_9BACT